MIYGNIPCLNTKHSSGKFPNKVVKDTASQRHLRRVVERFQKTRSELEDFKLTKML